MNSHQSNWREIESLFLYAVELPAAARGPWLEETTAGNPELDREVRGLLAAHEVCESAEMLPLIGPYKLERLLGRGGMGEVWLASRADGQFKRLVAIKLVHAGLAADILLKYFERERILLAELNHPNIAVLLDAGLAPDRRPYFVMQYIGGEPLLDYCAQRRLPTRPRLQLFRQICSAVEYAHRRLIVHCDLKSANILVTREGVPVLLDFGVARLLGELGGQAAALLTPRYASPEQLRGERLTAASDIYSLGILLSDLLTVTDALKSALPADLRAIIEKATRTDPSARYGSVESFSADVAHYLAERPVSAHPPTAGYLLSKFVRRQWRVLSAAASVALLLIAATGISIHSARTAQHQRIRAERVASFLEDMIDAADPAIRRTGLESGRSATLVDVLGAGSSKLAGVFPDDPITQAELHRAFARTYVDLGMLPEAEHEIRAALAHRDALASDPREEGQLLFCAGVIDYRAGRLQDAEQKMREGIAVFSKSQTAIQQPNLYAVALSNLAMVLSARGHRAEAGEKLGQAESIMRNWHGAAPEPPPADWGVIENNLGMLDRGSGDLDRAERHLRQAIWLFHRLSDPPVQLAEAEMNLGLIERFRGHYQAALADFEHARTMLLKTAAPTHPDLLTAGIELAYQRGLNGELAAAEPELRLLAARTISGPGVADHARALLALRQVISLGGKPKEAEPLLREALAVRLKRGHDYRAALVEFALADCLESLGRTSEARHLYQGSFRDFRDGFGPNVWVTLQAAQRLARFQAH